MCEMASIMDYSLETQKRELSMNTNIREAIRNFSDQHLIDQYLHKRDEYTEEALIYLKEEIDSRNIDLEQNDLDSSGSHSSENDDMQAEDSHDKFVPLDHNFFQADILLAQSILNENKIPFIITNAQAADPIPLHTESNRLYTVHVPEDLSVKAQECIRQHFDNAKGYYQIKYSSVKERLKSFQFFEIHLSEEELNEEVEVQFTPSERADILTFIKRLQKESDMIEQQTGEVLFYADNLEECARHLEGKNNNRYTNTDLLTILEVIKMYCDSPDAPASFEKTGETLLDFFSHSHS